MSPPPAPWRNDTVEEGALVGMMAFRRYAAFGNPVGERVSVGPVVKPVLNTLSFRSLGLPLINPGAG